MSEKFHLKNLRFEQVSSLEETRAHHWNQCETVIMFIFVVTMFIPNCYIFVHVQLLG